MVIREIFIQYNIKEKVAKISALSAGKINKFEYLTDEKTLPSDKSTMIEQAKFTCSFLRKALEIEKTNKNN